MKKEHLFSVFVVCSVFVVGGVISIILLRGVKKDPEISKKNYILKFGHCLPFDSAQHVAALKYASLVKKRTAGRVEIKIFPDQELGNDHQMIEATRNGELAIVLAPTAKLSSLVPAMQYFDLPFFHFEERCLCSFRRGSWAENSSKVNSPRTCRCYLLGRWL